ncbi:MAG: tetratricopeptide repeat protein [Candidatus Zixiibacteriota bacterium]|nr:MAG: tetratricopeptide repeat protein [candidate division Zixibacteria bacterium]
MPQYSRLASHLQKICHLPKPALSMIVFMWLANSEGIVVPKGFRLVVRSILSYLERDKHLTFAVAGGEPVSEDQSDRTRSVVTLSRGMLVGHYRIIEKIGAGGMGEVYLAEDTELNRQVALKFLSSHLCQDGDCRARFKREAQAAAKLDHPNIVTVYEVGEFQGRPFFAMQHIEGRSLREYAPHHELSIPQVLEIGIQIAEGLQAAHEKGVTHRDIKPANVLIDTHGRARILDFGLATVAGTDHLTKTGSTLGTIGYMSPEQVRGEQVDHRTDIFSLGVVLYELVTGRQPFKGDNEVATVRNITDEEPEPLARYKTGVTAEQQRIISKALAKDKSTRYQHADELAADLKSLIGVSQILTRIPVPKNRSRRLLVGAVALVLLVAVAFVIFKSNIFTGEKPTSQRKMLAVLPFENLGSADDEYFADGMTDEITTSLTRLSGLGIISRTSSMQYKNTEKSLRQIGKELDVDYILNGTIRWEKKGSESRVRINPQLIKVSGDLCLWANRFDAVLTDVFEVQSTIAQQVATALEVTLLQTEQEALSRKIDIDPVAYDYYLRGKQYFSITQYQQKELLLAEKMHLKAINQAPEFAQAYAELGCLYTEMYWDRIDPSPQRLDSAKKMIDVAMRLAPNTPESHQALGWYYYHGLRDYDRARDEFSRVIELQPNNTLAMASIAWVQRRQGKLEEAIAGLQTVTKLDPLDAWYKYELGVTYHYSRRYQVAIAQFDKVIDLQPNHRWVYIVKSWAFLNQTGETREARGVLDAGRACNGRWPELTWLEVYYDLCDQNYDHALSLMTAPGDVFFPENPDSSDYYYMKGFTLGLMGQRQLAKVYLDSARVLLEIELLATPDAAPLLSSLANVYAGLDQSDKAVQMAKRAVELNPVSSDALSGPGSLQALATIYASVGQQDQAIELCAHLLEIPSNMSANMLRLAPQFDSLRDNPHFQSLLKKYEKQNAT